MTNCESVRDGPCEEPAVFEYVGPVPPAHTQYKFQQYRARYKLCLEHGHEMLTAVFGYYVRGMPEGLEMRRLDKTVLHFMCRACGRQLKYEYVNVPSTVKGPPRFCPSCGTEGKCAEPDPQRDYWELLSEALGGMNLTLVQLLYDDWLSTPNSYPRFTEYVASEMKKQGIDA